MKRINKALLLVSCMMSLSSQALVPKFNKLNSIKNREDTLPIKHSPLKTISITQSSDHTKNLSPLKFKDSGNNSEAHQREQQYYKGLPIFGAELVHHYKSGNYENTTGQMVSEPNIKIVPTIDKIQALETAKAYFKNIDKNNVNLVIFPGEDGHHLAWQIEQLDSHEQWNVFVDAHNAKILDYFNSVSQGIGAGLDGRDKNIPTNYEFDSYVLKEKTGKLSTYDMQHCYFCNGKLMKSIDDYWTDSAAVDAQDYAYKILNVLKNEFKRDSFDDKGTPLKVSVHKLTNYVQAEWSLPNNLYFGDGNQNDSTFLSGALDVVAHELFHGITAYTSKLIYRNESGALNESFSDIFGTYMEYKLQPKKFDWLIGEDVWTPAIAADALRYMQNPTMDGISKDHYSERYIGKEDEGGVHINSGIVNLAFYLLAQGGKHPRLPSIEVTGIGIEQAAHIFYNAFTNYLTSNSNFKDAKKACLMVAQKHGSKFVQAVDMAWKAVGVN